MKKRKSPSKSAGEMLVGCDQCRRDEESKNPVFDRTHVLYHTRHYPWAMGWDFYINTRMDITKKREEAFVICGPKCGDQVVIASHNTFWPFEDRPDCKQICGSGVIRAIKGRELNKVIHVEVHEWFHEGPAPAFVWVPLYHLCQVDDVTRLREDLETAWNFVGISRANEKPEKGVK